MFGVFSENLISKMNNGLSKLQDNLQVAEKRFTVLQGQKQDAQNRVNESNRPKVKPLIQTNVSEPINPSKFQILDTVSKSYGGNATVVRNDEMLKGLVSPLDRISVSSAFGTRQSAGNGYNISNSGKGQWNVGIDLNANVGTPLKAMGGGRVVEAGQEKDGNKKITVQLDNGLFTQFNHLNSFNVKVGDVVKANQVIGATGASGGVTGAHLDPMIYFKDKKGKFNFIDSNALFKSFQK